MTRQEDLLIANKIQYVLDMAESGLIDNALCLLRVWQEKTMEQALNDHESYDVSNK